MARLSVNVLSDTGRSAPMTASPPPNVSVSMARVEPAVTGAIEPPLPPAEPDTALPGDPRAAEAPARLLPPILRHPATVMPGSGLDHRVSIELEVRVDVRGRVIDVQWAGGERDSALVLAARRCAASMEFYPALHAGRPVEVWCRQRFDIAPR